MTREQRDLERWAVAIALLSIVVSLLALMHESLK